MVNLNTEQTEESCRDSLFNLYFDGKKYNLIEDMKSFGEQQRLPKMLHDMDRVKIIYKEYFDAGFLSATTRLEGDISELTKSKEVYEEAFDDLTEDNTRLKLRCQRYESIIRELESQVEYLEKLAITNIGGKCKHQSDGSILFSNPPKYKCKYCGEFYDINVGNTIRGHW